MKFADLHADGGGQTLARSRLSLTLEARDRDRPRTSRPPPTCCSPIRSSLRIFARCYSSDHRGHGSPADQSDSLVDGSLVDYG